MFGIGTLEFGVVLLVLLLVLGPEQLPAAAAKLARIMREFNRVRNDVVNSLNVEIDEFERQQAHQKPRPRPSDPPRQPDDAPTPERETVAASSLTPPPSRHDREP